MTITVRHAVPDDGIVNQDDYLADHIIEGSVDGLKGDPGSPGEAHSTRTALAALTATNLDDTYLSEAGREGKFVFTTANMAAKVAKDAGQAVYIAPASAPTGASGAWVRQFDGPLNIKWFGATGNGSTDDSEAFRRLNTFCGIPNGTGDPSGRACFLPFGDYYIASMVTLDAPISFRGELGGGGFQFNRPTRITFPASVTAFNCVRGVTNYFDNGYFTDVAFQGLGVNNTATTGSMAEYGSTLTLASAADFQNGQVIIVRGAGFPGTLRAGITAATTSGSPIITQSIVGPSGCYVGMELSVTGAGFPAGTKVVSMVDNVVTLSANATTTVTAGTMTTAHDMVAMIVSGGGTTTLTLAAQAQRAVTNAQVIHGDCAIFSRSAVNLERVEFTGSQIGVAMTAGGLVSQPSGQATNANCATWTRVVAHGCRIGVFVSGNDANACNFTNIYAYSNSEYCIVDACFLGNSWFNSHTSGGLGIINLLFNCASLYDYAYTEGGTVNAFGANATGSGIQSGDEDGGLRQIPDGGYLGMPPMRVWPKSSDTTFQSFIGERDKSRGVINFRNAAGSSNLAIFSYSAGAYRFFDAAANKVPFAFTDSAYPGGAGKALFAHGIDIGNDTASTDPTTLRRMIFDGAAPTTGTWRKGDIVWNNGNSTDLATVDHWRCSVAGTPGTWIAK